MMVWSFFWEITRDILKGILRIDFYKKQLNSDEHLWLCLLSGAPDPVQTKACKLFIAEVERRRKRKLTNSDAFIRAKKLLSDEWAKFSLFSSIKVAAFHIGCIIYKVILLLKARKSKKNASTGTNWKNRQNGSRWVAKSECHQFMCPIDFWQIYSRY